MPGWRGLLRAALALLLAPAVFTVIWIAAISIAQREINWALVELSWRGDYPLFLLIELLSVVPVTAALLVLRRLTILKLMLCTALLTCGLALAWIQLFGDLPPELSEEIMILVAAVALIYGFCNTGFLALLAGVLRWPAVQQRAAA